MTIQYVKKLLENGFNCISINSDKTPLGKWKQFQDEKNTNIKESIYYGLICGYNNVECIDIDLKVIKDVIKRKEFTKELFAFFDDNIDDFKNKVVIKKTINNGYHIIYQANNIQGNLKLAKLDGSTEAVIETRGIGGYICMYDEIVNKDYLDIQYITDEERSILISCCKTFNEVHEEKIQIDRKTEKQYSDIDVNPWTDFNNKNHIWDIISSEFTIVKKTSSKIIVKRHGAKSPHSGYIFTNSNCLYLFSSATIYPNEKLISPFVAYSIKNHNSDYTRSASYLYSQGYGSRKKPKFDFKLNLEKKNTEKIVFPIEIYPKEIQHYILELNKTLNNSIDYMGSGLLWLSSLIIGNAINVEVKKGWTEIATIWIAIVGSAGVGKSPALNSMLFPLFKINSNEIKKYQKEKEKYEVYSNLDKKEKNNAIEVLKPVRTQFIVDDVTIEALINLHSQNKNGVGIFKDELAGWFKDMNKYKEGSDKEQWLSSWSGRGISVDRITRQSDYIDKPILPVLGGIQPSILANFFTQENTENGFLDRMLFSYPELKIDEYIDANIDHDLIRYYSDWVLSFYEAIKMIIVFDEENEINPNVAIFSEDAKIEWVRIFNNITKQQNSDETPEFLKSFLAKQKSYVARFSLIINTINALHNGLDFLTISKDAMLSAEKLSNYFIEMNKKMVTENKQISEDKIIFETTKGTKEDKIMAILTSNPDTNKTELAKKLGISRKTLYKYITSLNDKK